MSKSTNIAVISLEYAGKPSPAGGNVEEYDRVKAVIIRALKGNVTGEVSGEYNLLNIASRTPEKEPEAGSTYIVFMQFWGEYHGKKHYKIIRFSSGEEKHVAEVTEMVSSMR